MTVVVQLEEIEALDQTSRRIAGDRIHLSIGERAVAQGQIHHMRRRREMQAVGPGQPRKTVGPLQELVAESGAPPRRLPDRVVDRLEAERARVAAADQNRKRVVEAERTQKRAPGPRIQVAHLREHGTRIGLNRLMEDRRQRGSRVLDVHVDVAG